MATSLLTQTMTWVFFLIPPLASTFFLSLFFLSSPAWSTSIEKKIERSRRIADFSFFNAKSLSDRLQLRAIPNERLITAFGIRNSLTITDEDEYRRFLRHAARAMKSADGVAWRRVRTLASETLDVLTSCPISHHQHGLSLE